MGSNLDPHRDVVAADLQAGLSDLQIQRNLAVRGCEIDRKQLSQWISEEQAAGRLPVRQRRNLAGCPKDSAAKPIPELLKSGAPSLDTLLFITEKNRPSHFTELPLLFPLNSHSQMSEFYQEQLNDDGLLAPDGKIDVLQLARQLGTEQVARITELEFFLLALRQLREAEKPFTWKQIRSLALEALEIRRLMRQAVALP